MQRVTGRHSFVHTCVRHDEYLIEQLSRLRQRSLSRTSVCLVSNNVGHAQQSSCLMVRNGRGGSTAVSASCTAIDDTLKLIAVSVKTIFGGRRLWKIARFWSVVTPYLIFKKFLPSTNRIRPIRRHSITITKHENGRSFGSIRWR